MELRELLTAFWPLLVFQLSLTVAALISIGRRGDTKKLPKMAWIVIVILLSIVGPIIYFMIGKGDTREYEQYRD